VKHLLDGLNGRIDINKQNLEVEMIQSEEHREKLKKRKECSIRGCQPIYKRLYTYSWLASHKGNRERMRQ
jgi:hypothetical protein